MDGQSIKALVDTGAATSVVGKEVLQEVYKEQLLQLQTDNFGDVKTVTGEALPVLGMFTTALDIANGNYSCTFMEVQDLRYDALLERDFLRENGAIINLKESTLQLDGKRPEPYPERKLAQGKAPYSQNVLKNSLRNILAKRKLLLNKAEPHRNMPYTHLS